MPRASIFVAPAGTGRHRLLPDTAAAVAFDHDDHAWLHFAVADNHASILNHQRWFIAL
jgi:hypothetical protein